jgi:hypothetical protein
MEKNPYHRLVSPMELQLKIYNNNKLNRQRERKQKKNHVSIKSPAPMSLRSRWTGTKATPNGQEENKKKK